MTNRILSTVKPLALGLFAVALFTFAQGVARADTIVYSTAGSFSGSGTNSVTFGSNGNTLTLTFAGIAPSQVNANPSTFASFGTINTSTTGSGATIPPGTTLTINITQTAPTSGTGSVVGTLTGTLTQNSSSGVIT